MATAVSRLTIPPTPDRNGLKPSHSDTDLLDSAFRRDSEQSTSSEEGVDDEIVEPEKTESDQDQEVAVEADRYLQDAFKDEDNGSFQQRRDSRSLTKRTASITDIKTHAFDKLQEELLKMKEALQLKDEQVSELSRVREEMDREIEDLTASLFEEAHAMVLEANTGRAASQKSLKEASGKIDMLQAEVQALKLLVITSTPSSPHPVSPTSQEDGKKNPIFKRSKKKDKKSVSQYSHQRNHSLQGPLVLDSNHLATSTALTTTTAVAIATGDIQGRVSPAQNSPTQKREVDPLLLRDFEAWHSTPVFSQDNPFISRVFSEDIQPCLNFTNQELSKSVLESVQSNTVCIEPCANEKGATPRRCALTDQQRPCSFRIKLGESSQWCHICTAARSRITAVCDFYTYLRYIQQGLVKSDLQEVYWEMIRLRKEMSLVKLGLQ